MLFNGPLVSGTEEMKVVIQNTGDEEMIKEGGPRQRCNSLFFSISMECCQIQVVYQWSL